MRVNDFPEQPQSYTLYLIGQPGREWLAGLVCPCGCGDFIELVLEGNRPRWRLLISLDDNPTLSPSVHRSVCCRSHFFLEDGLVLWCSPSLEY